MSVVSEDRGRITRSGCTWIGEEGHADLPKRKPKQHTQAQAKQVKPKQTTKARAKAKAKTAKPRQCQSESQTSPAKPKPSKPSQSSQAKPEEKSRPVQPNQANPDGPRNTDKKSQRQREPAAQTLARRAIDNITCTPHNTSLVPPRPYDHTPPSNLNL